ncbi:hypothetical protein AVEN_231355-1 [Araneus ventricosus]|uniref:Uncharacterized protein n=1 Tax=Araneus ventricosus TaxID=182803 RepID=A0A4Y1ZW57_ARAVE|nr:hypothetical protein AVEN_231355-1 [Araneus ventricosus]
MKSNDVLVKSIFASRSSAPEWYRRLATKRIFPLQDCKLFANLSRQVCKCKTSLQQVNASLEVTIGRICSKLALQTIAKTENEHIPGWNSRPTGLEADGVTTQPVKL